MYFLYFLYNQTHQNKINNVFLIFYFILFLLLSLFYSFLFFLVINLQQRNQPHPKPKSQPNAKLISLVKQTLAFKPINFLGKQTQKNPQEKQTKTPQITTTESKNINIKSKQKNRNPTSNKAPPPNQIFQNFLATSKTLRSNLQKS